MVLKIGLDHWGEEERVREELKDIPTFVRLLLVVDVCLTKQNFSKDTLCMKYSSELCVCSKS